MAPNLFVADYCPNCGVNLRGGFSVYQTTWDLSKNTDTTRIDTSTWPEYGWNTVYSTIPPPSFNFSFDKKNDPYITSWGLQRAQFWLLINGTGYHSRSYSYSPPTSRNRCRPPLIIPGLPAIRKEKLPTTRAFRRKLHSLLKP